jgi:hypothetical protein
VSAERSLRISLHPLPSKHPRRSNNDNALFRATNVLGLAILVNSICAQSRSHLPCGPVKKMRFSTLVITFDFEVPR